MPPSWRRKCDLRRLSDRQTNIIDPAYGETNKHGYCDVPSIESACAFADVESKSLFVAKWTSWGLQNACANGQTLKNLSVFAHSSGWTSFDFVSMKVVFCTCSVTLMACQDDLCRQQISDRKKKAFCDKKVIKVVLLKSVIRRN